MWAGKRRWTEEKVAAYSKIRCLKVLRSRYAIKLLQNVQCLIVANRLHAIGEKIIFLVHGIRINALNPSIYFLNIKKEAFSLVGLAVGTWPWKKNRNKLCLQVSLTIGIYYINFIQGKKIIVLSFIMNELGGDGEKDLHQCEEEFLPQKSIEAGSFTLFFVYPRSLGECFIAHPTPIPNFDDGEQGRRWSRSQQGELCECRLYASIRRSIS